MNIACLILSITLHFSSPDTIPQIDNAIYSFMAENNVAGVSLAIIKNEELVYVKGYGFADKEAGTRVTPASLFRIASISKPVTSMAIMKLMEEKKLSLDDKVFGVGSILGTKYGKQPYKKDVTEITIRNLLQHLGGGWGNTRNDPMFTDPSRSKEELISFTLDTFPLVNKPGTNYAYSNFGYCVLGRVIEKITGQPYEHYIRKIILTPAEATSMQIGGNTLEERKPNEVKYYGQKRENPYAYNISRMDSHGGWIASATDLVKLLMRINGSDKKKDILTAASIKTMLTAPVVSPRYACGWGVDSLGNFAHNGSLPGTRSELRKGVNGYGYALLLNTRGNDTLFTNGLRTLMETLQKVDLIATKPVVAGYQPSLFADSQQIKRMQAAFPVIERMYKAYAEKNKIPGIAFGIVGDGKLLYSGGFGYSDVEKKINVSNSSVYRIASMTKSFTAMAIIQLRDAGKLQLDDPVSKFIPEMNAVASLTDDSPPITIRNLLTHTAGFPEDNPWGDRQLQRTNQELLDFIKKGISLSSTPGLAYEYSNLGFAMLGAIVSKASGMDFEKYINKNIFAPLGMPHTYWEYTDVPADLLANGYRLVNDKWNKEEMLHSGSYGAMGGLLTSIEDFSKYINFHLSAWPPRSGNDTGIIKRSSLREMHLPGKVSNLLPYARNASGVICPKITSYNFGLAWSKDCTGKDQIGHSGGLPGFGSNWTFLPAYGIGLVSFCNLTYAATSALNAQIIDTLIAIAGLLPRGIPPSLILEQRKNELAKFLPDWKNAEAGGIFSENFFLDYFVDSLRNDAKKLYDKAGKIRRVGAMIPDNQLRGNFIIEGENIDMQVRFTLSPEMPGLIQQYSITEVSKSTTYFSKYKLKTISDIKEYKALVAKDPNQELVKLDSFIPGIVLDIRYATNNNLMKQPLYKLPVSYMRRPAAEALKKIQKELNEMGLGIKIYDGYRPYGVTVTFYETFLDSVFVASPYTGSRHNRGCAVDMTLIDLKTGKEIKMPTLYDTFSKKAHSEYIGLPKDVLKNRELLKKVMTGNGFLIYPDEWWHYDFGGYEKYPVMDIPFETLRNL
ncbi:MAG: serine hydrolase [Chitinophagaceae bacterium]